MVKAALSPVTSSTQPTGFRGRRRATRNPTARNPAASAITEPSDEAPRSPVTTVTAAAARIITRVRPPRTRAATGAAGLAWEATLAAVIVLLPASAPRRT